MGKNKLDTEEVRREADELRAKGSGAAVMVTTELPVISVVEEAVVAYMWLTELVVEAHQHGFEPENLQAALLALALTGGRPAEALENFPQDLIPVQDTLT